MDRECCQCGTQSIYTQSRRTASRIGTIAIHMHAIATRERSSIQYRQVERYIESFPESLREDGNNGKSHVQRFAGIQYAVPCPIAERCQCHQTTSVGACWTHIVHNCGQIKQNYTIIDRHQTMQGECGQDPVVGTSIGNKRRVVTRKGRSGLE